MNSETRGTGRQLLSIVVPVYNEQPNIEKFYEEATKAAASLDMDYEIIFVDDGSKDATPLILSRLTQQDEHVRAFILARNFGHQLAITCGMDFARGDAELFGAARLARRRRNGDLLEGRPDREI